MKSKQFKAYIQIYKLRIAFIQLFQQQHRIKYDFCNSTHELSNDEFKTILTNCTHGC